MHCYFCLMIFFSELAILPILSRKYIDVYNKILINVFHLDISPS